MTRKRDVDPLFEEVARIVGNEDYAVGLAGVTPRNAAKFLAWLREIPSGIGIKALEERLDKLPPEEQ